MKWRSDLWRIPFPTLQPNRPPLVGWLVAAANLLEKVGIAARHTRWFTSSLARDRGKDKIAPTKLPGLYHIYFPNPSLSHGGKIAIRKQVLFMPRPRQYIRREFPESIIFYLPRLIFLDPKRASAAKGGKGEQVGMVFWACAPHRYRQLAHMKMGGRGPAEK